MSPRFLADENIDRDLVLGLQRRVEGIDIVRVQAVGLRALNDPTVLEWAVDGGRLLVTREIKTVPTFASARITSGLPVAGVIVLPPTVSLAVAIDDVALIAEATEADEWLDRFVYLPLR